MSQFNKCGPYEMLYKRKCRSPAHYDEVGDKKILGLELIQEISNVVAKIHKRMKTTQSRQKSCTNICRKELECNVRT